MARYEGNGWSVGVTNHVDVLEHLLFVVEMIRVAIFHQHPLVSESEYNRLACLEIVRLVANDCSCYLRLLCIHFVVTLRLSCGKATLRSIRPPWIGEGRLGKSKSRRDGRGLRRAKEEHPVKDSCG